MEASPPEAGSDSTEASEAPAAKELIDRVDWDYYFGDNATASGTRGERDREEEDGRPYYENLLTRKPSLAEYLEMQINLSPADDTVTEIAPYLIGNIDDNGYLKVSAEETASALGKTLEEVEWAIAKIQTLDPAGVGARDLRECLMIQAREKGEEFTLPLRILTEHFDLFTRGDVAGVARRRELQLERDRVQDFVGRHAGIGQINGFDVRRQLRLQHVAQHGLAAADFAGHLDYAFAVADGVDQRFEYRPAIAAAEEKLGIGRDLERGLIQSEMAVIHMFFSGCRV